MFRLDTDPPGFPDGTVIWANPYTAEQYSLWTHHVLGHPSVN